MDHETANEPPDQQLPLHIPAPLAPINIIRPYDYTESDCGYCKGSRCHLVNKPRSACSKSYSLLADSMTPSLYEGFVYRGWRRSGIHLYKPCNFESCCPTLTIRLPTVEFVPSKSQSKLLRRMHHLVLGNSTGDEANHSTKTPENWFEQSVQQSGILDALEDITNRVLLKIVPSNALSKLKEQQNSQAWESKFRLLQQSKRDRKQSRIQAACKACAQISGALSSVSRDELVKKVVQDIQADAQFQSVARGDNVSVTEMVAHPPSGQIRCTFEVEDQRMSTSNHGPSPSSSRKSPARSTKMQENSSLHDKDKLAVWYQKTTGKQLEPDQRRVTIHTMPAHQSVLDPEVHQLYVYYQTAVHDDPNPYLGGRKKDDHIETNGNKPSQNNHGTPTSEETTNTDNGRVHSQDSEDTPTNPSDLDWGNAPNYFKDRIGDMLTSYLLSVPDKHRSVVLENFYSFYQFLVEAPFPLTPNQRQVLPADISNDIPKDNNSGRRASSSRVDCGLYHQHYRLGDMLIAVGVLDVLPAGLSSVYLFYHPTFSHELVSLGKYAILKEIEYARDTLRLPYYYLGYYIESCQKMRYKAEYKPSQLLCPKYYKWVDASEAVEKLQMTPRHVCPLVDLANQDEVNATGNQQATMALHQLQMDIGAGINVTIDMLQPSGVQVVKPILENFITEAGPDLSVQCLVKLS